MLATRIIPTILNKSGKLVKGKGFKSDRVVGNAMQSARVHAMRGVDELVILYVDPNKEPDYQSVKDLSENCFIPITVGGSIRTYIHASELLNSGADKVCIPHYKIQLIKELSQRYGSQFVTASIDVDRKDDWIQIAKNIERAGAGEILLQSVERDGTMQGYDLDLIKSVSEAVSLPVVASGGCSGYEDMLDAIKSGASAVAAGALFTFTDCTPKEASQYLSDNGVETRI